MEKSEVNILGCGSAVPTAGHMTTAQLVNMHEKVFLVDCGEGSQTQIWKSRLKVTNMNHIFISHAHGGTGGNHRQGRPGEEAGHRPLLRPLREKDGAAGRGAGRLP